MVLHKMGKGDEAWDLCLQIIKTSPTDDNLLNHLSNILKILNRGCEVNSILTSPAEAIPDLYEKAFAKLKTQELLLGVFSAYLRTEEVDKEKDTAMRLWKTFHQSKYLFWVIQATLRQAQVSNVPTMLVLAQRMFEKGVEDKKVHSAEELELYLNILSAQGDFEKILSVLEGPLGNLNKMQREVVQRRATIHTQLYDAGDHNTTSPSNNNNADANEQRVSFRPIAVAHLTGIPPL